MKELIKSMVILMMFVVSGQKTHAKSSDNAEHINKTIIINTNDLRVEFEVDNLGRATSKTVYMQNGSSWTPRSRYTVSYGESINVLTYAGWDSREGAFVKDVHSIELDANVYKTPIVLP